jgi:hypothetical protein
MFGRRRVSVAIGDVFVETLPGKKKIFKSMGIADSSPAETFQSLWTVTKLDRFNGLDHARLQHTQSGQIRTIALDALQRQDIYVKRR